MENGEKKVIKSKSKAGIYLAGILIFVGIILLSMSFTGSNYNIVSEQWEWQLTTGWNELTFTQMHLDNVESDNPVDVLVSIDPYWDFIFEDETWKNYWYNQEDEGLNGGTLQHIQPNVLYYINVTQDCVLTISDYVPPVVAITSSSWVTGVSGFFCLITGLGIAIKTRWF